MPGHPSGLKPAEDLTAQTELTLCSGLRATLDKASTIHKASTLD